jgi:endoglucanase
MKRGIVMKYAGSGCTLLLLALVLFAWPAPMYSAQLGQSGAPQRATGAPILARPLHPAPQLHVWHNLLVDSANRPVRLIGANRSGTEYACLSWSIFDGPSDQASINAMLSWHINAIRVPLNEDCWLNINLHGSPYGGAVYQQAIERYVQLLISNGITPILDLHWTAPGNQQATQEEPMPDRDHALTFWWQVAEDFKWNDAVIFDLFNEPFPDRDRDTLAAWNCWRDGTNAHTCPLGTAGLNYNAAGMQELVTTVRSTGATNVIMLGGIQYAATLDRWMNFAPSDPAHNLAASWHLYNFSYCNQPTCWGAQGLQVMRYYPVITGEMGENRSGGNFMLSLMNFLDHPAAGLLPQSYLAWTWNTDQTVFDLISNYSGAPTSPYGVEYRQHLLEETSPYP